MSHFTSKWSTKFLKMPNRVLEVKHFDLFDPLKQKLIENLSFSVYPGESLHIVGENGVGKTALLRALFSSYRFYSGHLQLNIEDFSYLPQLSPRMPKLPVSLGEICSQEYSFFPERIMKKSLVGASGGERKRAMLAKVFSENKRLIVLDEPLNHLDQNAAAQVGQWLAGYLSQGGTLIYTGHSGKLPQQRVLDLEKWRC